MTDEQTIKNAEHHKLGNCSQCYYKNYGSNCLHELLNDSIKMAKRLCDDVADFEEGYNDGIVIIGRLKAELKTAKTEIEILKKQLDVAKMFYKEEAKKRDLYSHMVSNLKKENAKQKAMLEAIDNEMFPLPFETDFDKAIKTVKSEALIDFAERLKRYSFVDNLSLDGKETVYVDDVDNIVKEMMEVEVNE